MPTSMPIMQPAFGRSSGSKSTFRTTKYLPAGVRSTVTLLICPTSMDCLILTYPSFGSLIYFPIMRMLSPWLMVLYDWWLLCLLLNCGCLARFSKKFLNPRSKSLKDCWSAIESTSFRKAKSACFLRSVSMADVWL